jgi:multicomponent Na+:H+ antiporter subunit A
MLVMLIGVGTEAAITGAILFLIAHAFYKGALFLIAGTVDHATGTRDVTQISGLFSRMPVSAVSALLAAISMAGLPISLGYFAKDVIYTQIGGGLPHDIAVVVVALLGNGLMMVVGLVMALGLFFGARAPTPKTPHEGPLSMIVGSLLIGVAGIGAGLFIYEFTDLFVVASASAVYNFAVENHLETWHFEMPLLALSAATWGLGALAFWYLGAIRTGLRRVANVWRWGPDRGFDQAMFGLIRSAGAVTRFLHHGKLEFYLIVLFMALSAATFGPVLLRSEALPPLPAIPHMSFYEWGIMVVALIGLISVVVGRTRLVAIVSLGIQGFAVAIIFMQFGAPDLSFTQFMVEIFSVVILALVMTRLRLDQRDHRILEEAVRDGALAIVAGAGMTLVLYVVLQSAFDPRLSEFFARASVPLAHGHNIVNVILVDFRALDTLGEITVVLTAGIAILALIRIRTGAPGRRGEEATAAAGIAGSGPGTRSPASAERSGAT